MAPGICSAVLLTFRTQATPTCNTSPPSLKDKNKNTTTKNPFPTREECAFEGIACLPGDLQLVEQVASALWFFWSVSLLLFYPPSLSQTDKD